jgi:hypothetical protein
MGWRELLKQAPYFTNGQGLHSGNGSCADDWLVAAKNEIAIAVMSRIFFNIGLFSP